MVKALTMKVLIVPEPRKVKFTGRLLKFDGFKNFPEFLSREFNIPRGGWNIVKVEREGNGVRVREGEVEVWGDERICYATLIQLVMQYDGSLPEVEVEESFNFGFRGFHLDIARGGVPKVETFKRILRWLFLLKYNYFAIYFEDLFPWRSYPQIGKHRGGLTPEEYEEILNYGAKLGVEVFPSLELSGHMEHILTLPEFRRFSEWHRPAEGCLNVSDKEAREFAYTLLKDAIEASPSGYIHIGGDETWALGRGKSLSRTWSFEGPRLYEMHHRRMVEMVRKAGKTPILWGDMISGMYLREDREKWAEAIESEIWKEVIVANWDYSPSPREHFLEKIRIFKDRGIEQIACPGLSNWNRYYPNFQTALKNLENFLMAARDEGVMGFLITAWGDDGEECLFSFLDPLLLAAMEIAEGKGAWEEKWMALKGESGDILKARFLFGEPDVSDMIKHVIYRDFWFKRLDEKRILAVESRWRSILEEISGVNLPEDLDFIRRCLIVGLKMIDREASPSDYIALANAYSRLWLDERKKEGLDRIIGRFWGAAGRIDAKII